MMPLHHPSSYRDPSGFIFQKDGTLYRQVNQSFREDFDHFVNSGCYLHLVQQGLLISHEEVAGPVAGNDHYRTLQPEPIDFISYPYEWCFDMLRDAALLTLQLMREALHYRMILKDATPFNVQWHNGRLIFIDTLSFERYEEKPWIAYRQFCENFLAPLLLMHHRKVPLQQMQLAWPEGVPLNIARSLLPWKTKLSLHTYLHIHLHASVSNRKPAGTGTVQTFSRQKLINLLSSLETVVSRLRFPEQKSTWSHYYDEAATRESYLDEKKKVILDWLAKLPGLETAADLGANEGEFSRLSAEKNIKTIAADFDAYCINRLYRKLKTDNEKKILPLILDLSNPSPAIGVNNEERDAFLSRLNRDIVFGLALIHHLSIGKNIPFSKVAQLFHGAGKYAIVEFVPKTDEKIKLMLTGRKDIYNFYTEENFVSDFSAFFTVEDKKPVGNSGRMLYLFKRR